MRRFFELPYCGYCQAFNHFRLCRQTNHSSKLSTMQKFLSLFSIGIIISSCSPGNSKKDAVPDPPSSVKAVHETIKGKKYKAGKAGIHSLISTDKEIQWLDPGKEDKFEKETAEESMTLQFDFINDTSITVAYKNKTYNGTYAVDDASGEGDKPGIKLRVSYVDEEFKFGEGPASKFTYTYIVEGIGDKSILLQTPRSMNQRNIVVLMNKQ